MRYSRDTSKAEYCAYCLDSTYFFTYLKLKSMEFFSSYTKVKLMFKVDVWLSGHALLILKSCCFNIQKSGIFFLI